MCRGEDVEIVCTGKSGQPCLSGSQMDRKKKQMILEEVMTMIRSCPES